MVVVKDHLFFDRAIDHVFYDTGLVMLVWNAYVRQQPVFPATAWVGTLPDFDLQPFFLAAKPLVDPLDPSLLLKLSSADRT